ncbi:hypothetical protein HS088_TW06G01454 [Tripterygium wilfordii]|uniref:Uncharacterized protein n=1 Tax=Tripterygium wilfordii TaxID=458696 RepID=A0A7J7DLV1_TRIWF|nr:hypothetical protein HS088_TW06G01454 [Tripterygium wilfordii]
MLQKILGFWQIMIIFISKKNPINHKNKYPVTWCFKNSHPPTKQMSRNLASTYLDLLPRNHYKMRNSSATKKNGKDYEAEFHKLTSHHKFQKRCEPSFIGCKKKERKRRSVNVTKANYQGQVQHINQLIKAHPLAPTIETL